MSTPPDPLQQITRKWNALASMDPNNRIILQAKADIATLSSAILILSDELLSLPSIRERLAAYIPSIN